MRLCMKAEETVVEKSFLKSNSIQKWTLVTLLIVLILLQVLDVPAVFALKPKQHISLGARVES